MRALIFFRKISVREAGRGRDGRQSTALFVAVTAVVKGCPEGFALVKTLLQAGARITPVRAPGPGEPSGARVAVFSTCYQPALVVAVADARGWFRTTTVFAPLVVFHCDGLGPLAYPSARWFHINLPAGASLLRHVLIQNRNPVP